MKTPEPPVMMREGVSPRACWARWVEGWKKLSRSQRASWSLVSMSLISIEKRDAQRMHNRMHNPYAK